MSGSNFVKFIHKNPVSLILLISKTLREFFRACFVSTALYEGIYEELTKGPATASDIQRSLGTECNREGLEAWLELGVSIGELQKKEGKYSIKGPLSKMLLEPSNDTWKAFLRARAEIFHDYVIKTPSYLRENRSFDFSQAYGELFARSSRTVEPILIEVVDKIVPPEASVVCWRSGAAVESASSAPATATPPSMRQAWNCNRPWPNSPRRTRPFGGSTIV